MNDESDLSPIRRTAVYGLASTWLDWIVAKEPGHRLRHPTTPVGSACELFSHCFPGLSVDRDTMAVALFDLGYDLAWQGDLLRTNVSEQALFAVVRGMRCLDAGMTEGPPGQWTPNYTPPDAHWPERLARIDAEIAARRRH